MADGDAALPGSNPGNSNFNQPVPPGPAGIPPVPGGPPPSQQPVRIHQLENFPVVAIVLLHFLTCGIFTLIWLNLMHGKMPKVRADDPSAGRAVGFCFIPFFNLYWIFFTYRRLCLRIDEQRSLYGMAPSNLTGLATGACVLQIIPYVNVLAIFIVMPIFAGMVQSSVNDLVNTSATTAPRETLQTLPAGPGMPVWAIVLIVLGCSIFPVAIMAGLLLPALAKAKEKAVRINCANNLKQVGLAFRIWEGDHGDVYPFNVSTNKGGTFELSVKGPDGFDIYSWRHFQVMSNELNNPRVLICPADTGKQPAIDFAHLQSINVTYVVHPGTNVSDINPQAVLAICPIHHNVLLADGSVQQLNDAAMHRLMDSVAQNR